MTRIPSLAFAASAVLTGLLLGACASAPVNAAGARLDDIVRTPLAPTGPAVDAALGARSGVSLAPSRADEPERIRREEALRRELGVDQAPDGSWDGCSMRGWGEGC
jgi:hypothetical protein